METLLLCLGLGFALLLVVAITVAVSEQLRDSAQLARLRETAQAQRAFDWNLAAQDRDARGLAFSATDTRYAADIPLEERAVLPGDSRRSARPAVGQPSSGWTETEPMVLGGPSQATADRSKISLH